MEQQKDPSEVGAFVGAGVGCLVGGLVGGLVGTGVGCLVGGLVGGRVGRGEQPMNDILHPDVVLVAVFDLAVLAGG